jgi:hypothetical protein
MLAEAAARGEFLRIPSVPTIYALYGSWSRACNEILPGRNNDEGDA